MPYNEFLKFVPGAENAPSAVQAKLRFYCCLENRLCVYADDEGFFNRNL